MNIAQYLQEKNILFTEHKHPAVYTCEEAEKYCADIPGLACKNLFVKNKKKTRYILLVLPAKKRVDMKMLGEKVGGEKLSFASAELLKEKLNLEPGAVSPFGLINDTKKSVEVFIDQEVMNAKIVSFHPNKNTATLELTQASFEKYLKTLEQKVQIIDI